MRSFSKPSFTADEDSSRLVLQGTPEEKEIGAKLIETEKGRGFMSDGAVKVLNRKLKKVDAGEHDVYI